MRLSELPEARLHVRCGNIACSHSSEIPLFMLIQRGQGHRQIKDIIVRLACQRCGAKPSKLDLVENLLRDGKGVPYGWVVPLVEFLTI